MYTKRETMTNSTITKTLKKVQNQPKEYSIGFRRLTVLHARVRKNLNLACIMNGETNNNSIKEYLNNLTEQEYINWLKLA